MKSSFKWSTRYQSKVCVVCNPKLHASQCKWDLVSVVLLWVAVFFVREKHKVCSVVLSFHGCTVDEEFSLLNLFAGYNSYTEEDCRDSGKL